jgi:cell division transport system permease protein
VKALLFFIQEAWSSLRRNLSASLAAVTAMGAVLFLLSLLMLLSHNILLLAGRMSERKGVSVFLDPQITPEHRAELEQHFAGFAEVRAVRLITRDEALRDIESELEGPGLQEALGENPLPDVFVLTPTPGADDVVTLRRLARELEAYDGVEDVLFGERWVEALDQGLAMIYRANAITGILAVVAIMLVLANTLRLIVIMRDESIAILKMIGATDAFVRSPFVIAGVFLCLMGALLSLALLYAGFAASGRLLPGLVFLPPASILLFLGGVGLVGVAGSLATVELSLRQLERRRGRPRR